MADQLGTAELDLSELMDTAATNALVYVMFPGAHRTKGHGANPTEHLDRNIDRRADASGSSSM